MGRIPEGFEGFDNDLAIMLYRTLIEKWLELMLKEIDAEWRSSPSLSLAISWHCAPNG
jgi:hypothetical protein